MALASALVATIPPMLPGLCAKPFTAPKMAIWGLLKTPGPSQNNALKIPLCLLMVISDHQLLVRSQMSSFLYGPVLDDDTSTICVVEYLLKTSTKPLVLPGSLPSTCKDLYILARFPRPGVAWCGALCGWFYFALSLSLAVVSFVVGVACFQLLGSCHTR